MAVNYMDRLAAMRGDRQHAAGAHGRVSAPVLHADEHRRKHKKKRKLSRKQKAALAKGQRKLRAMHRAARRRAREEAGRGSMSKKRRHGRKRKHGRRAHEAGEKAKRTTRGRKAVARRKAYLARKRGAKVVLHGKAARRYAKKHGKKSKRIKKVVLHGRSATKYMRSHKKRKHPKKRKHAMARKSSKRSRAAKKAARTRKHNKEIRRAAARKAARSRKRRGGHKRRSGHKRAHSRRAAPRRRKRGGRARRRSRGLIRRQNRTGKFVGRGGRIHGRKRRGGYHRAGRIVREGYSMENPLGMSELATGLVTGLVGYLAADITDRYLAAGRPPLGGTLYAEASPIYSDYVRLGVGVLMGALPLVGAHFIDGAKHAHIRAGLQFFGFGAGIRTLGHLVSDLISSQLKSNSMVGSTVQALYPHEIVSQGQLAGVQSAMAKGTSGLPEHIAAEVSGLGAIPEGLAACCNTSSRMLNAALSPLQPIGRNMDGGGSANPPPPVALPPPIERIVQQPYSPPSTMRQATPIPMTPPALAPVPAPVMAPGTPPARAATVPTAVSVTPTPMVAAFAPAVPPAGAGVRGLPSGPFGWGEDVPG